tara:strand:+ start:209 stop:877 length:669 start_codon:yes stop_codon:yes gene_type:complete
MARFNKMTGKIQGLAGRNAGRKARRFAKLAMRSRVTGKDIKRRLQDEASEGIKVGISEGGEFLDESTGEEYKGVWHLDEESGAIMSGTEDDEDSETLVPISAQAIRKIPIKVRRKAFKGTRGRNTKRRAELFSRTRMTIADVKRQVRADAPEGVKVAHTDGGDFLVEETGREYRGWYIIDQDGTVNAGTDPEDDGDDLIPISPVAMDKIKRHVDEDDGYNRG